MVRRRQRGRRRAAGAAGAFGVDARPGAQEQVDECRGTVACLDAISNDGREDNTNTNTNTNANNDNDGKVIVIDAHHDGVATHAKCTEQYCHYKKSNPQTVHFRRVRRTMGRRWWPRRRRRRRCRGGWRGGGSTMATLDILDIDNAAPPGDTADDDAIMCAVGSGGGG